MLAYGLMTGSPQTVVQRLDIVMLTWYDRCMTTINDRVLQLMIDAVANDDEVLEECTRSCRNVVHWASSSHDDDIDCEFYARMHRMMRAAAHRILLDRAARM